MKTLAMCVAVALCALLMACTAPNTTPSPNATVTPSPTANATAPAQSMGTNAFGRYGAAGSDALYYASDGAIWQYQNGNTKKLCDIPDGQAAEDLYVPSATTLFFTARLETPDKDGYDRILYRLPLDSESAAPQEHARSAGPIAQTDDTMHVLQDGEVICINATDNAQLSCANVGKMARLLAVDTKGDIVYYNVFKQTDNGMPFGEAELMRLDMDTQQSTSIGEMYKANANTMIRVNENTVYKREPDGDNYLFTILDSNDGGINAQYPVQKSLIDDQAGSESLYLANATPYMLIMGQTDESRVLTCYQLKEDGAVELWKSNISQNIVSLHYDEQSGCVLALCEGGATATFHLYALNAQTGTQTQSFAGSFGATQAQLLLCDVGGTALVFSVTGEDFPKPTLLYAARMDNLNTPLVTGNAATGE